MRLICPNCGAQYEVADDVIPQEGRDVQCSNCANTWFQVHPSMDEGLADELEESLPSAGWASDDTSLTGDKAKSAPRAEAAKAAADTLDWDDVDDDDDVAAVPPPPPPAAAGRTAPRRALPEDVESVLREEAAREAQARKAERGGLESQPDLGLDTAPRRRPAQATPPPPPPSAAPDPELDVADLQAAPKSRKNLLPDVEELTSTLESGSEERTLDTVQSRADDALEAATSKKSGGFRRGMSWSFLLALVAFGVYFFGYKIAEFVPQAGPYIAEYTGLIDTARVKLDELVKTGLGMLDSMSSEGSDTE